MMISSFALILLLPIVWASEDAPIKIHWEESGINITGTNNTYHDASIDHRQLPAMGLVGDRWHLPDPIYYFCDDSAAFVMRFTVSDYISDDMFRWAMYSVDDDGNCGEDITGNNYMIPGMVFDETPVGDGSGTRQVGFFLDVNSYLIESSPVYKWNHETDNPYIHFCTQTQIWNDNGSGLQLVNWIDIEYLMEMNLQKQGFDWGRRRTLECFDGFEIVFDVTLNGDATLAPTVSSAPTSSEAPTAPTPAPSKRRVIVDPEDPGFNMTMPRVSVNASDSYEVFGYLCDPETQEEIETDVFVRGQGGSTVTVCVERTQKCIEDNVWIRYIDGFAFSRDSHVQVAVEPPGIVPSHGLTEMHCERGSHKCWFETLLTAGFFTTPGYVFGAGAATLQFGQSTGSRSLRSRELADATYEIENSADYNARSILMRFSATTVEFEGIDEEAPLDHQENGSFGIWVAVLLVVTLVAGAAAAVIWRRKKCVEDDSPSSSHRSKRSRHSEHSSHSKRDKSTRSSTTRSSRSSHKSTRSPISLVGGVVAAVKKLVEDDSDSSSRRSKRSRHSGHSSHSKHGKSTRSSRSCHKSSRTTRTQGTEKTVNDTENDYGDWFE